MEETLRRQNLKCFKIYFSSQFIQIEPMLSYFKSQILIDKIHGTVVFQKKQKKFVFNSQPEIKYCSLILGIFKIKNSKYLIYADSIYQQPLMQPGNQKVYQIANLDYLVFANRPDKEQQAILEALKKEIFSFGFYFSLERDLTSRSQSYYSQQSKSPISKYWWNQGMLDMMIETKNANEWKIPVIQGYYGKFQNFQGSSKIIYYLIARRSKFRSGTRFYSRGIDEHGNCSNTIQTQQIIIADKVMMSCVFITGSSPIFWQQKSQSKPIQLSRNKQLTRGPFVEHIKSLNSQYGNILLINLLQRKKQYEKLLTQAYEQIFSETQEQTVECCRYFYFDINQALKQGKYNQIGDVVNNRLDKLISNFGCFIYDLQYKTIKAKQNGIFRVSCLDCLNRTEKFLECLAMKTLEMQLGVLGMEINYSMVNQLFLGNYQQQTNTLIKSFKLLWTIKADFESLIYTGTRSASGRKDKLLDEIDNSFVALQRLYNEKFIDRMKQTVIGLLHPQSKTAFRKALDPQNVNSLQFRISIVTWNVNATSPDKLNLNPIIHKFKNSDLIVFGIQQMIELVPNNVMAEQQQTKIGIQWEKTLAEKINELLPHQKFIFIQKEEMVGVMLIIFINQKWKNALRSVHKDIVKTGYGGQFGNKGGVVIRVSIYDNSFCFTCVHLAAGQSKVKERIDDFIQIHKKAFQQNKQGVQNQLEIEESDFKFFLGDMNFRIKGEYKSFADLIQFTKITDQKQISTQAYLQKKHEYIVQLTQRDQLISLRMQTQTPYIIASYEQQKIQFFPTYKLQKNTGFYTTQKSRNPSWCDRILYWSDGFLQNHNCECVQYNSINAIGSDHRPVYGQFLTTILKQQNKATKSKHQLQILGKQFRDTYFDNDFN